VVYDSCVYRFVWLAISIAFVGAAAPAAQSGKKALTFEQAFSSTLRGSAEPEELLQPLPTIVGWLDDEEYLQARREGTGQPRKLYAVRAADGVARLFRDLGSLVGGIPADLDPQGAIATSADYNRFVYDKGDDLYYVDVREKAYRRLTGTPDPEENPRFSPDGQWIAYTRRNNLFAYDLTNSVERQLTSDGSDTILNGVASWVYFEEVFDRSYATFWWSPDSTQVAFMQFDDSPVPVFPIYHASGQHGTLERQRYPKAGDPNPYVRMGVVKAAGGNITWMDFPHHADHYLAWPFWTPDSSTLIVQWLNRGQDTLRLYGCDPATGSKKLLYEERQSSWVDFFTDIRFLSDGGFILRSSRDGWEHLYLHNRDGTLRARLTSGNWRVDSLAGVDEQNGVVYFVGRPGRTWDAQLMRVRLTGGRAEHVTNTPGVHKPVVSPGGKYFIDTVSTVATPAVMTLHASNGARVRELGTAATAALAEYQLGKVELFTIPSGDGYDLPACWVLPADFDASERHPVRFVVYGGPDAGRVHNSWVGLSAHYWAARGVIMIAVDHRASGHFGKKGVALMHRNLGKWEMTDLITAAKWLRAKPFVAPDRIGISGGSYGGYTTLMALTRGGDHFNYGIAGSPVTDWRLYDTIYTERYMDTPAENPEGYKAGAILTDIDRYKGGLRITHGTVDDNVHMQHTLQLIDWLTNRDKSFELMLYPGSRHGLQSTQRRFDAREAHDFWMRTLLAPAAPHSSAER
jgi:dipeptidyl-peptidase 4